MDQEIDFLDLDSQQQLDYILETGYKPTDEEWNEAMKTYPHYQYKFIKMCKYKPSDEQLRKMFIDADTSYRCKMIKKLKYKPLDEDMKLAFSEANVAGKKIYIENGYKPTKLEMDELFMNSMTFLEYMLKEMNYRPSQELINKKFNSFPSYNMLKLKLIPTEITCNISKYNLDTLLSCILDHNHNIVLSNEQIKKVFNEASLYNKCRCIAEGIYHPSNEEVMTLLGNESILKTYPSCTIGIMEKMNDDEKNRVIPTVFDKCVYYSQNIFITKWNYRPTNEQYKRFFNTIKDQADKYMYIEKYGYRPTSEEWDELCTKSTKLYRYKFSELRKTL